MSFSELSLKLNAISEIVGSIPEKYMNWIRARQLRSSLFSITGQILSGESVQSIDEENKVIAGSRLVQSLFKKAVGLDNHASDDLVNFPYRRVEGLKDQLANSSNYDTLAKDILHRENTRSELQKRGIQLLPGAVVNKNNYIDKVFNNGLSGKPIIRKSINGTDGNGIFVIDESTPIDEVFLEDEEVIIEEYINPKRQIGTLSAQVVRGEILGVTTENPKDDQNRWLGNMLGVHLDLDEQTKLRLEGDVLRMTNEFNEFLKNQTGEEPEIFGLDFMVYYDDNNEIQIALIDPNIRMPGNIFMYTDKSYLEHSGMVPKAMKSVLLYENEIYKGIMEQLLNVLQEKEIGLLDLENIENPKIRNNNGSPRGILPVVQDRNGLTMLNVFGRDQVDIQALLNVFLHNN